MNKEFLRMQQLAGLLTEQEEIKDMYGEIESVEEDYRKATEENGQDKLEYLNKVKSALHDDLADMSNDDFHEISITLNELDGMEQVIAIKNIKKWVDQVISTLTN